MYTTLPLMVRPSARKDGFGSNDMTYMNGKLPIYQLAGLAHEVVRRLAYRENDLEAPSEGPSAAEVETLCQALISDEGSSAAESFINDLAQDTPKETIYLQYFAEAARTLGDWWMEDRVSFTAVTVATGQLIELLRKFTVETHPSPEPQQLKLVFASVPGEQHTLGIRMAADLFRDEGWEIALKLGLSEEELVDEVKKLPHCIVGLSIGGRHSIEELASLVEELHKKCPHVAIVVSGQDIEDLRPRLSAMGLDIVASELNEAREKISALWDQEMVRATYPMANEEVPKKGR